uniref:LSM14 domain-containing protein n=1 Tax=Panagrellus redivivus TaxID=6233 RepID=A0A7E4VUB2_PANRE
MSESGSYTSLSSLASQSSSCSSSTSSLFTMTSLSRLRRHHRPRGIVSSIVATGTARIIYNDVSGALRGILITSDGESFGLNCLFDTLPDISDDGPSTSSEGRFFVTDGDTGDQYSIEGVTVHFVSVINPVTNNPHRHIKIDHPTIKFATKDLYIGNRAELEVQQHLGAQYEREIGTKPVVHCGEMQIKIVTSQKIEPGYRRESICDTCTIPIVEQSEDFLV